MFKRCLDFTSKEIFQPMKFINCLGKTREDPCIFKRCYWVTVKLLCKYDRILFTFLKMFFQTAFMIRD